MKLQIKIKCFFLFFSGEENMKELDGKDVGSTERESKKRDFLLFNSGEGT